MGDASLKKKACLVTRLITGIQIQHRFNQFDLSKVNQNACSFRARCKCKHYNKHASSYVDERFCIGMLIYTLISYPPPPKKTAV